METHPQINLDKCSLTCAALIIKIYNNLGKKIFATKTICDTIPANFTFIKEIEPRVLGFSQPHVFRHVRRQLIYSLNKQTAQLLYT